VPGGEEPEICTSGFSLALVIPDKKLGLYGVIPYLLGGKDPIFGRSGRWTVDGERWTGTGDGGSWTVDGGLGMEDWKP